jgi:hypothetical protein
MSNYTKAQAILNHAVAQVMVKPIGYNVVMVQSKKNFKRTVVCSHTGQDAEKIARSQAGRLQWDEDDRCGGSSSTYFMVEAK